MAITIKLAKVAHWYESQPMSKITDLLYVGNYGNAARLTDENLEGIQAVLNVSTEPPYNQAESIQYRAIRFDDGHEIPLHAFAEAIAFLQFQHETGHKTLVHCAAGISRSPSVVAAFLHHSKQYDLDLAFNIIRKCRPIVQPHPLIIRSIKKHLHVWPYDGSTESPSEAVFVKSMPGQEFAELVKSHPDPNCGVRQAYSRTTNTREVMEGEAMHKIIQCTCEK